MRLCLALRGEEGVRHVLRPQLLCGVNCSFLLDMNGSRLRLLHTRNSSTSADDLGWGVRYFRLDAGLLDLSVRGERVGGWSHACCRHLAMPAALPPYLLCSHHACPAPAPLQAASSAWMQR